MKRALTRTVVWPLTVVLILAPLAPVLEAQDLDFGVSGETGYVEEVRGRLADREGLEQIYQRAYERQSGAQQDLAALQQLRPGPGDDPNLFYQRVQEQMRRLRQEVTDNQGILDRTRQRLAPVYQRLEGDRQRVQGIKDPNARQELGTLIGAGGAVVVPIWTRLTSADIGGMVRHGAQRGHLATVRPRANLYGNIATNAGQRAANAEAALAEIKSVRWVPEADLTANRMVLRAQDAATGEALANYKEIKTDIPAKIRSGTGDMVENPNALRSGNDMAQLYNTRSQLGNEARAMRLKASRAINAKQQQFFESRAQALEAKKVQLEVDIAKYQAENPSLGMRAKALAADAGKWAVMSVGITLAANAITQLAQNGWDPQRVDWGQATAFLGDPRFWTGTAGSFLGSMAGTAIASALPGGVFVKALLSIGGAAVGWQVGSGQFGKTDWVGLGVTTVGSTVGFLLGMAIGGPVGAFVGGILGHIASQYIYDKVRDWLIREEAASSGPVAQTPGYGQVDPGAGGPPPVGPPGYEGPPPVDTGYGPGGGPPGGAGPPPGAGIADLNQQMNEVYMQMVAAQRAGDQSRALELQQRYQQLRTQLQQRRRSTGAGQGYGGDTPGQ